MPKTYKIKSDVVGVVSVGLFAGQRPDGTIFESFQVFGPGEEIENISPRIAQEIEDEGSASRFIEVSGSSDNPFEQTAENEETDELSKEELQAEAESLGLSKSGSKAELRARISEYDKGM